MSIGCKLIKLKQSSSDWLKSHEEGYSVSVKRCDLCVFLFHKVVQSHYLGEVKNKLFLYCLIFFNVFAKNYTNRTILASVIAKNVQTQCIYDSTLSSSISPSLFHCMLKIFLFRKSFPP